MFQITECIYVYHSHTSEHMLYDAYEVSMDISFLLQLGRNCLLLGSVLKNERILTKFLDCGADVNVKAHVRMYVCVSE